MAFSSLPLYQDPPIWQQNEVQPNPNPNSMSERARMANIPMSEGPLNCPRCDSTNTKFCYFNNYSLTQPRHFCKACRRYWTRGGALRSVPVGGGCRRNKRRKRNKSPKPESVSATFEHRTEAPTAPPLTFMASLQNLGVGYGGFGGGLTEPLGYHPFHQGIETASFGVKMEEMRARVQEGQQFKGGVMENMSRFWGGNFNSSVAGSANGGNLWN